MTTTQIDGVQVERTLGLPSGGSNKPLAELSGILGERSKDVLVRARELLGDALAVKLAQPSVGTELDALVRTLNDLKAAPDTIPADLQGPKLGKFLARAAALQAVEATFDQRVETEAPTLGAPRADLTRREYLMLARALWSLNNWQTSVAGVGIEQYRDDLVRVLEQRVRTGAPISLMFFVCPPQQFGALETATPEHYFGTQVRNGSFLSSQRTRFAQLFQTMERLRVPYEVHAIMGDRDEGDYLWPVLGVPKGLDDSRVDARRHILRGEVRNYLTEKKTVAAERLTTWGINELLATSPSDTVAGWKDAARVAVSQLPRALLERECERMRELWTGDNAYYKGIPMPDEGQMRRIVNLKFEAYAVEGLLLSSHPVFGSSVLVQAERPVLVRAEMMNSGLLFAGLGRLAQVFLNPPE